MRNWELVEPVVEAHCAPAAQDYDLCRQLARNMAGKLNG